MQYHQVVRESILTLGIKPQRPSASWSQPRLGLRISARKQRHLMPLADQFFRKIRHHPLSAAIELWWTTLTQRGDLRDSHSSRASGFRRGYAKTLPKREPRLQTGGSGHSALL